MTVTTAPPTDAPPSVLRVASTTPVPELAGGIAHEVRRAGWAELRAVGAGAVNQAVKGSAVAVLHLAASGIDAVVVPSFIDVNINGEHRSAMALRVEARNRPAGA